MSRPFAPNAFSIADRNVLAARLQQAFAAYNAGDLPRASSACKGVLAVDRRQFDALQLMGLIEFHRANHGEALRLIRKALKVNPHSADALTNYAQVLSDVKGPEEALPYLDRALTIKSDHVIALNNRGNFLWRLKRPEAALASLDRALALAPDYADAHCNRGNVLCELEQFDEALESFDRALAINPSDFLAWHNRGNALCRLKRLEDALLSYQRALAIKSNDAPLLSDCGNALQLMKRWQNALAVFDRLLVIKPNDTSALHRRGHCLWRLRRPEEALATYERVLALEPNNTDFLGDRANVLSDLGRFEEARACYDKSILVAPENAGQYWNRALLRLRTGDFQGGWQDYEWRLKTEDGVFQMRHYPQPRWNGGQPLQGKTILLYAEQGLGDTIQFVRYASMVAARGARVILDVHPQLKDLFAPIEGVSQVIATGEEPPPFDYHCPLMSLPLAFNTALETLPGKTPGLRAPADRVAKWSGRLATSQGPRIGISWGGNPNFMDDAHRSIGLARLSPLLATPGLKFFSIQKELRPGDAEILQRNPQVSHLGSEITDFGDTAAIMSLLDVIISSDTSVVHLAGALDRPVWILLHQPADWRWMLEREDSPWYPSARLFRQKKIGAWDEVVARVGAELGKLVPAPAA